MKYVIDFNFFENINEKINIDKSENYLLNNKIVHVLSITRWGEDEYRVSYIDEYNKQDVYIGTVNDIDKDFISTDKKIINKNQKKEKTNSKIKKYDLCYFHGDKLSETIEKNISYSKAAKLKSFYTQNPNYKLGKIKIIPVK